MLDSEEPENLPAPRTNVRRAAIASQGTQYSTLDQVLDTVCTDVSIKTIYLTCATTLTISLIVEGILLNLIILPSFYEANFKPSLCYLKTIERNTPMLKCENKCSKERSMFPCLRVHILHELKAENYTAILYDTIGTHENYKKFRCATSVCRRRIEENNYAISVFRMALRRRPKFRCFVSERNSHEALLFKFHQHQTIFHSVFWPTLCFGVSFFVLLVTLSINYWRARKHRHTSFAG